jgi:hypothetical protein
VIKIDRSDRRIGLSIKAANYSQEQLKEEEAVLDALKPGEDLVALQHAFDTFGDDEGESKAAATKTKEEAPAKEEAPVKEEASAAEEPEAPAETEPLTEREESPAETAEEAPAEAEAKADEAKPSE